MIFRADLDRSHQKSSTNHGDLIGKVCFFYAATISWVNMVNYPHVVAGLSPATDFLDAATLRLVLVSRRALRSATSCACKGHPAVTLKIHQLMAHVHVETLMWDPPNVTNHYGSQGESHMNVMNNTSTCSKFHLTMVKALLTSIKSHRL